MKKKWIFSLIALLGVLSILYVFLSIKKIYATQKTVASSEDCVRRHFINKSLWDKLSLGKKLNDSTFINNDITYTITKVLFNGFQLSISNKTDSVTGVINFEGNTDPTKCTISFSTNKNTSSGVFADYHYSNLIKKFEPSIDTFIACFENYFNSQKKVYGFEVKMERTEDPNLLVYKQQLKEEPTVQEIYQTIDKISAYIKSKNGAIKNPPMLNVFEEAPQIYDVMIALPTMQFIEGNATFLYKQLVKGNILTTEIKGGPYTIKEAEKQLKNYVEDNKKVSPAIPYQSLVTNRLTESDTSKWITKLYYPVFF